MAIGLLGLVKTGDEVPCWYDPRDPGRVVLSRRLNPVARLLWLLPVPFILFGLLGLRRNVLGWNKSELRNLDREIKLAKHLSG